ncbi:MAG: hypothetical protein R3E90_02535 [Marinicella sp.]
MKKHWDTEIDDYLMNRESLIGVVIIMDIRHPMKVFDEQMLNWAHSVRFTCTCLIKRNDKLNNNETKRH